MASDFASLYRLGNHPDSFDARDTPLYSADVFQSSLTSEAAPSATSDKIFVLPDPPPIYAQLNIGSCVANAVAAALRYAHKKTKNISYTDFEPSRMFIYYNARTSNPPENMNTSGTPDVQATARIDSGTHNRSAIHSLLVKGVCTEHLWPYGQPSSDRTTKLFNGLDKVPNPIEPKNWNEVEWEARPIKHQRDGADLAGKKDNIPSAINYYRIFDPNVAGSPNTTSNPPPNWGLVYNRVPISLFEKTLLGGFPIVFGVRVLREADLRDNTKFTNGVFVKPPDGKVTDVAGHAMLIIGFDPVKRLFCVQNSWGDKWPAGNNDQSMQGRFWMPYEWFEFEFNNRSCTYDYWVIKTSAK